MTLADVVDNAEPKYKEYFLSLAEPIKGQLAVGFRNIETGEQTEYTYIDWLNAFVIRPKIKKTAYTAFHKTTRESIVKNFREKLKKELLNVFPGVKTENYDRAFSLFQIFLPLVNRDILLETIENFYKNKMTKLEKKVINKEFILPAFYKDYIRNKFGEAGDVVKIDTRIFDLLKQKREINKELKSLEKSVEKFLQKQERKDITRHMNEMHKVFEEYKGDNYEEIKHNLRQNTYAKKLNSFWHKRKTISDKVVSLDEKIKQIDSESQAFIHDDNKDKKSSAKNYTIDTLVKPDIIKSRRKPSGEELREQKWVFIDIEKPRFNSPDEEVSWATLVYYENGKIIRKETHSLRNTGKKKINDRYQYHYETHEDFVQGLNKSITKQNPYGACAYNNRFDFIQLREMSDEVFGIGANLEEPRITVSQPFFERIGLRGKMVYDGLRWAQMFLAFLPNKKLNLVAKQVLGKEAFDKSVNYDQLAELEQIAVDGIIKDKRQDVLDMIQAKSGKFLFAMDKEEIKQTAALVEEEYVAADTEILPEMLFMSDFGKQTFDLHAKIAQILNLAIDQIPTTNNMKKMHDWKYFEKVGVQKDAVYAKHSDEILKKEMNALNRFKTIKNNFIKHKNKPGLHNKVYEVYVPLSPDCLKIFNKRENTWDTVSKIPTEYKDNIEKYFYSNVIEAILREASIDYAELDAAYKKYTKDPVTKIRAIPEFRDFYKTTLNIIRKGRPSLIGEISNSRINAEKDDIKSLRNKKMRSDLFNAYLKQNPNLWQFLLANKLKEEDVFNAFKRQLSSTWTDVEKKYWGKARKFCGKYANDPNSYEKELKNVDKIIDFLNNAGKNLGKLIQTSFQSAEKYINQNGFDVIYKNGNYLYLTGENIEALRSVDCPLVLVDEIESALVSGGKSDQQKIFYDVYGYKHGIKITDQPNHLHSMYEMSVFGKFLDKMFALDKDSLDYETKKELIIDELSKDLNPLFNNELTKEDMIFRVKSKKVNKYDLIDANGKIKDSFLSFNPFDRNKVFDYDTKSESVARSVIEHPVYQVLTKDSKGRKIKKEYLSLDEISDDMIDKETYQERIIERTESLLKAITYTDRIDEVLRRNAA